MDAAATLPLSLTAGRGSGLLRFRGIPDPRAPQVGIATVLKKASAGDAFGHIPGKTCISGKPGLNRVKSRSLCRSWRGDKLK